MEGVTMKRIPFGGLKPILVPLFIHPQPSSEGCRVTMKRIPFGGLKPDDLRTSYDVVDTVLL
jgi:hypothetical protein